MLNEQLPDFIEVNGQIYKKFDPDHKLPWCPICDNQNLVTRKQDGFEEQQGCMKCDRWFGQLVPEFK